MIIHLHPKATLSITEGELIFRNLQYTLSWKNEFPAETTRLLRQLGEGGVDEEMAFDSEIDLSGYYYLLLNLQERCFLSYSAMENGGTLFATLNPLSSSFKYQIRQIGYKELLKLSSFALLRRKEGRMILETPLSAAEIVLVHKEAVSLIHALSQETTLAELEKEFPHLSLSVIRNFIHLLAMAEGLAKDEQIPPLVQWEFHDLYFHTRSRMGRHLNPFGGTCRFIGKIEPPPVFKPPLSTKTIPLYRPDIEFLKVHDIPFTAVLESRKSIRGQQDIMKAEQLGEFLYRSARVKEVFNNGVWDLTKRPSPCGGAIHELEIYPLIYRCEGIPFALYHYDPLNHCLEEVAKEGLDQILECAWNFTNKESYPQVVIVITARFLRPSWKYETGAYSVIMKDVGALYQTMYLVATAMKIHPCAFGDWNADLFSEIIGTNYYEESLVGQFRLGGVERSQNLS